MRNEALFTYWKRPWHKWLILAAAVLQLLSLWLDLRQYRQIVDARVFSAAEMASYTHDTALRCAFSGLMAACFFAALLIGLLARSKRAARMAEGVLLLALGLAWGLLCGALGLFTQGWDGFLCRLVLGLTLCGGACCLGPWRDK